MLVAMSTPTPTRIAAVQMVAAPDWQTNREAAARLVAQAAASGAQLVALPEYFCIMGRRDTDKLAIAESAGDGPIQRFLSDTARQHGIWLVGGTLPVRVDA
ncbi:MAG TPA: nitrilase-related carbon-nitrogen hydrolase, partial [Rubrivivax sp.]|nr:nitrilase-related carbon-nitrogen hydrolase [Rubrivivax sp.]